MAAKKVLNFEPKAKSFAQIEESSKLIETSLNLGAVRKLHYHVFAHF